MVYMAQEKATEEKVENAIDKSISGNVTVESNGGTQVTVTMCGSTGFGHAKVAQWLAEIEEVHLHYIHTNGRGGMEIVVSSD